MDLINILEYSTALLDVTFVQVFLLVICIIANYSLVVALDVFPNLPWCDPYFIVVGNSDGICHTQAQSSNSLLNPSPLHLVSVHGSLVLSRQNEYGGVRPLHNLFITDRQILQSLPLEDICHSHGLHAIIRSIKLRKA